MEKGSDHNKPKIHKSAGSHLAVVRPHKMAISKGRHFGRGEVIGWSEHELSVLSSLPVETATNHKVRFHVQKNQGLMGTAQLITREGEVLSVEKKNRHWLVEIELEGKLEKLNEYITKEDSCYLFFISKDEAGGIL